MENSELRIPPGGQNQRRIKEHALKPALKFIHLNFRYLWTSDQWLGISYLFSISNAFQQLSHDFMGLGAGGVPSSRYKV